MKEKFFLVFAALIAAFLLAFRYADNKRPSHIIYNISKYRKKNLIHCGPDWELLKDWIEDVDIPPIPGAGNYKMKISTNIDSAQFYFNQGINMYYSFHLIEAMASFKKASKFDPDCGTLYWAQALAYGPNINYPYTETPDALAASKKALAYASKCTEKEKVLMEAQRTRYSDDSTLSREKLNQLYVDKMKEAYNKFPNDADIATLYADALMQLHPWDLWKKDGTPKPWTPLIREILEKTIATTPENPGANHYYIHVMEPSPYPDKALPSANRLGKLTPGLSHTVHMPSHIYLRTGYYNKGTEVNVNAVNSYKKSIPLYSPVTGGDFLYLIHNLHMQTNNAMLAGRSAYSVESAKQLVASIAPDYLITPAPLGSAVQYIYMTPLFVDIRFGKWDEIINYTKPDSTQVYANVLYHFGRGMAFSQKQNFIGAAKELDEMRKFMKDSSLNIPFEPFSAAIEGAKVAEQLLLGVIHEQRKMYDGAIRHFSMADSIERNMVYNEPRDWLLNPKHYLGNAYLKVGKWKEAENIFLKDLKYNKENGWALHGLYQSLMSQNNKEEAGKVLIRFKKAFEKADIKLSGSII